MFIQLLSEIKSLQSRANDKIYPCGIFPCQRRHIVTGVEREDDNSFFSALIVFTLQRLKRYFSADEWQLVEEIKEQVQKAFPLYKNKHGENTYNFWRTEKNAHFPNGKVFSKFGRFRLADDVDCTALIYLANGYSTGDIIYLKNKLLYHAGLPVGISNNTLAHYQNLKVYSTWFGKNIPKEIDVCVTANLLYLLYDAKVPLNESDTDCVEFVCSVIMKDEHKTQPFRIAPYYPNTSIVLYHVSRLLTVANHYHLLKIKEKLKTDILEKLKENNHPMERIILNTSLIWLGETSLVEELEMPVSFNFPWFVAGMLTSVGNALANKLAQYSFFHMQFYCEAYMKTLFVEYLAEKGNHSKK